MDDGDPHWPEGEEPGRGLGTVLHLRRLRHPDCGHPSDYGGPLSLSPCAAVTLVRGSVGRGGDVSLAAQRAVLCQKSKMLGSICFHILMPKDVLDSEPQEVSSEQHSSLFPASREESLLCAVRVALLCSASFFSVLIMASKIFWGLCLGCFALAFNSFLSSEQ